MEQTSADISSKNVFSHKTVKNIGHPSTHNSACITCQTVCQPAKAGRAMRMPEVSSTD